MSRENWVDYAKAIGIVLVVYGHVARGVVNAGVKADESTYLLVDSIIYSFHMPLFFFLSGLFFCQSFEKRGAFNTVLSKVDTIVYPYVLWSILQGVIEVYLSRYTNGNVTFDEVFSLLSSPRAHFWFLYVLFFVFLVSVLIFLTPLKRFIWLVFAIAAVLNLVPGLLPDYLVVNYLIQYLVFFCFGMLFMQFKVLDVLSNPFACLGLAVAFVVAQWLFHGYLGLNYADKGVPSLLLALLSIVFTVSVSLLLAKYPSRVLKFIGASSMAIYLMHVLAGSGIRVVLDKFLHVDSLLIHIVAGCIVGIVCPLIAVVVINKWRIPFVFSAPISALPVFSSIGRLNSKSE